MKNREEVFKGRLISVFKGNKILPDKRKAYIEEVIHPGAALALPVADGKIVFVRQYRAVIDRFIWELPAGVFAQGEKPVDCAVRELQEETGYTSKKVVPLGEIFTSPGFCDEKIHIFKVTCGPRKSVKRDEHEIMSTRLFTLPRIKSLLKNGRIVDGKTIAALALAGFV